MITIDLFLNIELNFSYPQCFPQIYTQLCSTVSLPINMDSFYKLFFTEIIEFDANITINKKNFVHPTFFSPYIVLNI